jgi:hypothetical protein
MNLLIFSLHSFLPKHCWIRIIFPEIKLWLLTLAYKKLCNHLGEGLLLSRGVRQSRLASLPIDIFRPLRHLSVRIGHLDLWVLAWWPIVALNMLSSGFGNGLHIAKAGTSRRLHPLLRLVVKAFKRFNSAWVLEHLVLLLDAHDIKRQFLATSRVCGGQKISRFVFLRTLIKSLILYWFLDQEVLLRGLLLAVVQIWSNICKGRLQVLQLVIELALVERRVRWLPRGRLGRQRLHRSQGRNMLQLSYFFAV